MAITNGFDINKLTPLGQYFYQQNLKNSKNNINGNTISNFPIQNNSQSYDYGNSIIGSDSSYWSDMWNVKTPDNAYTQQPINANITNGNISALGNNKSNPFIKTGYLGNTYIDTENKDFQNLTDEQKAAYLKGSKSNLSTWMDTIGSGVNVLGGLGALYLSNKAVGIQDKIAGLESEKFNYQKSIDDYNKQKLAQAQANYEAGFNQPTKVG